MEARVGIEPAYTELQGVYLNRIISILINNLHHLKHPIFKRTKRNYRAISPLINQHLTKLAVLICAVFPSFITLKMEPALYGSYGRN